MHAEVSGVSATRITQPEQSPNQIPKRIQGKTQADEKRQDVASRLAIHPKHGLDAHREVMLNARRNASNKLQEYN